MLYIIKYKSFLNKSQPAESISSKPASQGRYFHKLMFALLIDCANRNISRGGCCA